MPCEQSGQERERENWYIRDAKWKRGRLGNFNTHMMHWRKKTKLKETVIYIASLRKRTEKQHIQR